MKKLILLTLIVLCTKIDAAPGDTTWIYANNVQLNYYNNFDTVVAFPNGSVSYRKILMYFTLGEYNCPSGSTYCHQWDYTVTNYVMTPTDTVELSRFITPFATTGTPRFPSTWQQVYIYNVTDFYTLLQDSAKIRILYSGYSGGFTANVKFAFIEGTPERNVYGVTPLWRGAYNYGDPTDPINNHVPLQTLTAASNANSAELKFTVTGHGSDSTEQCCEFALHSYSVTLNNTVIDTMAIWRDDCGSNELYAQGGTWIFDRGNWCPGDYVYVNTHPLTGITASSTYSLDVSFSPYSDAPYYHDDFGDYNLEGHVFYYGACNHTVDASLDDIISPNNFADHYRENPTGNRPVVHVRNAGSSVINSIIFSYNVKDSVAVQYTWNGTLASLHDTDITLNPLNSLTYMSIAATSGVQSFQVKILTVNGAPDEDTTNNIFNSSFAVAPNWPNKLLITMKTNSEGVNGIGISPSETSWQITNILTNSVVASRINADVSTNYPDTVILPANGFYQFTVTDGGCDGLHWWVWDDNPSYGITAGSIFVTKLGTAVLIPMHGYVYSGTYNNDFGCGFTQYFTTYAYNTGIETIAQKNNAIGIMAYPNPAQDNINIVVYGLESVTGQLEVIDGLGRTVLQQKTSGMQTLINLNGLPNGIYTIAYKDAQVQQIQTRMVIVK